MVAGIVSWLPGIITRSGQLLSILFVFSHFGSRETGHYFVALSMASAVGMLPLTMSTLLFPVLSGMYDGRKRLSSRVMNLGLAFLFPVLTFVLLYPQLPLSLLGREYVSASDTLLILLLSTVPMTIMTYITNLIYAYDLYLKVLILKLVNNIPRIALYYVLTPTYGGVGTALSYTIGSYLGMIYAFFIARTINFKLNWTSVGKMVIISAFLGFTVIFSGVPWFIGIIIIPISLLLYLKLGLLTKNDVRDIVSALKIEPIARHLYERYRSELDLLFS